MTLPATLAVPAEHGGGLPWDLWVFYRSVQEVERRLDGGDYFQVLSSSVLLRLLLLESRSLLSVAERALGVRAAFPLRDGSRGHLDAFLADSRVSVGNKPVTNADVVRACANKLGGAHLNPDGPKGKEAARAFAGVRFGLDLGGQPAWADQLAWVAQSACEGMRPLQERLRSDAERAGTSPPSGGSPPPHFTIRFGDGPGRVPRGTAISVGFQVREESAEDE